MQMDRESAFSARLIQLPQAFGSRPPESIGGVRILKIARLACRGRQTLCIVRAVSRHMMTVDVDSGFDIYGKIQLTFDGRRTFAGELCWRSKAAACLSFSEPLPHVDGLPRFQAQPTGQLPRLPRIAVRTPSLVLVEGRQLAAECLEVSLGGAKISAHPVLRPGIPLHIELPSLQPLAATVRWSAEFRAGIEFLPRIPTRTLMRWLSFNTPTDLQAHDIKDTIR